MMPFSSVKPITPRQVLKENNAIDCRVKPVLKAKRGSVKYPNPKQPRLEHPESDPNGSQSWTIFSDNPQPKSRPHVILEDEEPYLLPHSYPNNDIRDKLKGSVIIAGNKAVFKMSSLSRILIREIRRIGISQRAMADKLNMNSGTFSKLFVYNTTKDFEKWRPNHRKFAYLAYLWLNLPFRDRLSTFYPALDDFQGLGETSLGKIPELSVLLSAVKKEMTASHISSQDVTSSVMISSQAEVENLLTIEMPWNLMSLRLKRLYHDLWFWMKQAKSNRLHMLKIKTNPIYREPIDDFCELALICTKTLAFLETHNIPLKKFSEKILGSDIGKGEHILGHVRAWSTVWEEDQTYALRLLRWAGLKKSEKLTQLSSGVKICPAVPIASSTVQEVSTFQSIDNQLSSGVKTVPTVPIATSPAQDISTFQSIDNHPLDTFTIAENVLGELRHGVTTMKDFAKALTINRNFFSQLLRYPTAWENARPVQKRIYHMCYQWLQWDHMKKLHFIRQNTPLSVEANEYSGKMGSLEGKKKVHIVYTAKEKAFLIQEFNKNSDPSPEEKQAIVEELKIPMKKLTLFYKNMKKKAGHVGNGSLTK